MKFLVHLHIYYHNQVDYFLKKLSNIEGCDWDLYVTYVEENQQSFDKIKNFKPGTTFIKVANIGYDVWPFIQVIRKINLEDYDYVLKLHTKNLSNKKVKILGCIKYCFSGSFWRDELVNTLIGTKRIFKNNLNALKNDQNIGMIFSRIFYISLTNILTEETFLLYKLEKRLNLKHFNKFLAGTMFIIKSDALKILANSDINENDFSQKSLSHSGGSIAHVIERLFPMIILDKKYKVHTVKNPSYFMAKAEIIFKKLFRMRNSEDKTYRIIRFFGLEFHIPRHTKFQKEAIEFEAVFKTANEVEFSNKRAAIFAAVSKDGIISDENLEYLKEIKKYVDYLTIVSDNPILANEINKIRNIADSVVFTRHGEYYFGSYKRGYLKLKALGILEKIDNLLLFDDSVVFSGESLEDLFNKSSSNDFYGVLQNTQGVLRHKKYISNLHLQSWFITISNKIFNTDWFNDFIINIKKEKTKEDVIANYELGLSKLITDHGFKINSYYPLNNEITFNPDFLYAHPENKFEGQLFIKKRFIK